MRRHDARKWLHAILDLLPVILIPVFMIYSHRHAVADGTPVADVSSNVEYQYQYETNEVNTLNDLQVGKVYHLDNLEITDTDANFQIDLQISVLKFSNYGYTTSSDEGIDEMIEYPYDGSKKNVLNFSIGIWDGVVTAVINYTNEDCYIGYYINDVEDMHLESVDFYLSNNFNLNNFKTWYGYYMNLSGWDLPTASTFKGNIASATADVDVDIQYADSSVMNVFVDQFNETVNTYFNMGNVFGLNGIYEWFNTNIFGGNTPTIIYSVWNIALYELLMDLLMLLYALFMWFIDFCQDLIDRCFTTSKGGKH